MTKRKIKYDHRNFRKHSDENKAMIRKSLEELGAGRSVVVDADDELIAGNGVYEQAEALGLGVKVVETDGSELVVVKRTDLHTEDEKRKKLAMADNATSDRVEWNFDALKMEIDADTLAGFNIKLDEELPDVESMFRDANEDSFKRACSNKTGQVGITFVFEAREAELVNAVASSLGKEELKNKIVELCRNVEVR